MWQRRLLEVVLGPRIGRGRHQLLVEVHWFVQLQRIVVRIRGGLLRVRARVRRVLLLHRWRLSEVLLRRGLLLRMLADHGYVHAGASVLSSTATVAATDGRRLGRCHRIGLLSDHLELGRQHHLLHFRRIARGSIIGIAIESPPLLHIRIESRCGVIVVDVLITAASLLVAKSGHVCIHIADIN